MFATPSEDPKHAQKVTDAADYFRQLLGDVALIRETKPIDLGFMDLNLGGAEPVPDLSIVKPQRSTYQLRYPEAGDIFLLIEYANATLELDTEAKRLAYATAEVPEYWVVDLQNRAVQVFYGPAEGDYQVWLMLTIGGQISPQAFPELKIPITELV